MSDLIKTKFPIDGSSSSVPRIFSDFDIDKTNTFADFRKWITDNLDNCAEYFLNNALTNDKSFEKIGFANALSYSSQNIYNDMLSVFASNDCCISNKGELFFYYDKYIYVVNLESKAISKINAYDSIFNEAKNNTNIEFANFFIEYIGSCSTTNNSYSLFYVIADFKPDSSHVQKWFYIARIDKNNSVKLINVYNINYSIRGRIVQENFVIDFNALIGQNLYMQSHIYTRFDGGYSPQTSDYRYLKITDVTGNNFTASQISSGFVNYDVGDSPPDFSKSPKGNNKCLIKSTSASYIDGYRITESSTGVNIVKLLDDVIPIGFFNDTIAYIKSKTYQAVILYDIEKDSYESNPINLNSNTGFHIIDRNNKHYISFCSDDSLIIKELQI